MEQKTFKLYDKVLRKFGIAHQAWKLIEECGEMLDAFSKMRQGRASKEDVLTELADVHIMVEQMACFFGLEEFQAEKERKLARLNERLKKGE